MTFAIETHGLGKRFAVSQGYRDLVPWRKRRTVEVLRDVSLQIPYGEVFGLLGPNGAGKTTLFKILGTLILPTAGRSLVMGLDVARTPKAVKEVLTYVVSEERSLYWRLTGRQNLRYFAALNNVSRRLAKDHIANLLDLLDLGDAADRRVMYYSTGMRQKLCLARGLLTNPKILLLDEPTRSLDPLMSHALWQFIREELIGRQGKTVLFATHNLDEARRVCDRVAVLHRGKVRACGTVEELTMALHAEHRYCLTLHPSGNGVLQVIKDVTGVRDVQVSQSENGKFASYDFTVAEPEIQVPLILERVIAVKGKVLACQPHEPSLNDVLATLTKEDS